MHKSATIRQTAAVFKVNPRTVAKWILSGRLPGEVTNPDPTRFAGIPSRPTGRVKHADANAFATAHGFDAPFPE